MRRVGSHRYDRDARKMGPRSSPATRRPADAGSAHDGPVGRDHEDLLALNAVCPYYTMFPLDFPRRVLRAARKGDWVLDPFCGRGSTNFAARLAGLPSLGVDSNPVAVAIAQAKLVAASPEQVIAACRNILESEPEPIDIPRGEFWRSCFHQRTLADLCRLRAALMRDCRSDARKALRAFLLGRLHGPLTKKARPSYFSNQMPRTYAAKPRYAVAFWKDRRLAAPKVDVLELVSRKAVAYFADLPSTAGGLVARGDSRFVDLARLLAAAGRNGWPPNVRWIVTSPPYFGMRTYVSDQWLRYWLVGGSSDVAYSFDAQLTHTYPEVFSDELAHVWRNVASVCSSGARMVVRFGGIPDRDQRPRDILYDSFQLADVGWRIVTAKPVGDAKAHRRQASQFIESPASQVEEYDVYAELST